MFLRIRARMAKDASSRARERFADRSIEMTRMYSAAAAWTISILVTSSLPPRTAALKYLSYYGTNITAQGSWLNLAIASGATARNEPCRSGAAGTQLKINNLHRAARYRISNLNMTPSLFEAYCHAACRSIATPNPPGGNPACSDDHGRP